MYNLVYVSKTIMNIFTLGNLDFMYYPSFDFA